MIYKISFLSLIAFLFTFTTAQAISRNSPEKWAIMFLDENIKIQSVKTAQENVSMSIPMSKDRIEYEYRGYKVFVTWAEEETIIKAILDDRVKSISYYGHGGGTTPSFGSRSAQSWKSVIFMRLLKYYRNQGYSQKKACNLANSQSQNFGFKDVINRSCGSLYNNSIANQFVAPGNNYYGVRAERYYSCNPLALFSDRSDFTVDRYTTPQDDLTSGILGSWKFGRNKTNFIGNVVLTKRPGKHGGYYIDGYSHPNESYWKFNGKNSIVFLHENGSPTTYFKRLKPNYWEGRFLPPEDWPNMNNPVVHYLKR